MNAKASKSGVSTSLAALLSAAAGLALLGLAALVWLCSRRAIRLPQER